MHLCFLFCILVMAGTAFGAEIKNAPAVHQSSSAKKFPFDLKRLAPSEPEIYKYNRPEDLIELIPILRDINRWIPRQFALADQQFTLQPNELTVSHTYQTARSRSMKKDNILSFTYASEMGRSLDSELDVPLLYSTKLGLFEWERYPMGNYTMRFNRLNPRNDNRVLLRARTKF